MKVLCAVPPVNHGLFVDHTLTAAMPNIGLSYVAASVAKAGHETILIDAAVERLSERAFVELVLKSKAQVLMLTAHTVHVNIAGKVAAAIKAKNPSIFVVLGGVHATAIPERTLREFEGLDAVVEAEGEISAVELLEFLATGKVDNPLQGCWVRKDGQILYGGRRNLIEDLDSLAFPMFEGLPLNKYEPFFSRKRYRKVPLCTGRGCPFFCIFCPRPMGTVQRVRSVESVIEEIKRDYYDFKVEQIAFTDENFCLPPTRVLKLCEEMMRLPFKIGWFCETHATTLTTEVAKAMKMAGCEHVSIGVESGNPQILNSTGKSLDFKAVKAAVDAAKSVGLFIQCNYIIGFPNETEETAQQTINFAKAIDANSSSFGIMVPYPGTKIYEMARRGEGGLRLLTENWSRYGKQFGGSLELTTLPRYKMIRYQLKGFVATMGKPSKIKSMNYIPNFRILLRFGLAFLWTICESIRYKIFGPKKALVYEKD